jgi:tetratricopeptide (TPR) repeat protein
MIWLLAGLAFAYTEAETEVLSLYQKNQLITARRKAETILAENPDSIAGHFVLGCAFREEEGDLGQAMYHLAQARRRYETYPGEAPPEIHRELLNAIQLVAGEMDQYEYQLQVLDYYDYLHDPDLTAEHAWPLMKLGRFDEARDYANRAVASGDPVERTIARTSLCAIEASAGQRAAAFASCQSAYDAARSEGGGGTVAGYNAALAALGVLDFKAAETILGEAATRGTAGSTNPWRLLLDLYLLEGRGEQAVAAAGNMQRWKAMQPPESRDQNRAELDAALGTLMLVAGESEIASEVIDRALRYPDRRGAISTNAAQALGGHTTLRLAIRRMSQARADEAACTWGVFSRIWHWFSGFWPDVDGWADRATVSSVLSDTETLEGTVRLYNDRGLEQVPVWMVGDLADILGPGVVSVALGQVREAESLPVYSAYYDAIDADIAYAEGDTDRAISQAASALGALPAEEVMLRARMSAISGAASVANGDEASAIASFADALRGDPSVIRRLDLAIPARVENGASGYAGGYVAAMIGRSPRFYESESGFVVTITGDEQALEVCLRASDGGTVACAVPPPLDTPPPDPEAPPDAPAPEPVPRTDWELAQVLTTVFHDQAFALPVGSSSLDMRSLDGTTTSTTDANRERAQQLLDGLVKGQHTPR